MLDLRDEGNSPEKDAPGEDNSPEMDALEEGAAPAPRRRRLWTWLRRLSWRVPLVVVLAVALGLGGGFLLGRRFPAPNAAERAQAKLPESYTLPASYTNIGPALMAAGAIDYDRFVQLYADAGQPLTDDQLSLLKSGTDAPIVIDGADARFLLNFFWAFGLTNQNPVLQTGPMQQYSQGDIGGFASTGGWTLGTKQATALYASTPIVSLTAEQQALLEKVAATVFRPCCQNPTSFPDCNHGMAMLGMLELMASQGASEADMLSAAKYVNAFWFPQQTLELATLVKATQGLDFAKADARQFVGESSFSLQGFQAVHQQLQSAGLLPQAPGGGNNCGV